MYTSFIRLTGAHLQVAGVFGSDLVLGRFYGLGNPASALLLIATVVALGMREAILCEHQPAGSTHRPGRLGAALVWLFVIAVDAMPGLGTDVGGAVAFSITAALFLLPGTRLRWRTLLVAVGALVAALASLTAWDASRPNDERGHLGRLTVDVAQNGGGPLWETVTRKIDANFFGYAVIPSFLLLIAVIAALCVLIRTDWGASAFPKGSPERRTLELGLGAALLLYAANDSGIVVIALATVYLIPFVLVHDRWGAHRRLEVQAR